MESSHVQDVYDEIAPHFSSTRVAVWTKVGDFLAAIPPQSVLGDVGCGNGKYFGVRKDVLVVGTDVSEPLCHLASRGGKGNEGKQADIMHVAGVLVADGLNLPLVPECLDAVISIAVAHHLSTIGTLLYYTI